jgi:subtilisin family serine protease
VLQHEPRRCRARARLGLLDTAVDGSHPLLARARLRVRGFVPPGAAPAPADHGTAVASILVGAPPLGLLPEAELFAAEIFTAGRGGPEADALALSTGLDWLLQNRVGVIDASLAGPADRLVELAVFLARRRGAVLVAAAGNGGPAAPPADPAAYEGVVAVTAVDRELAPWRRANRGSHVALVGPGVDLPVAAIGGGVRPASGTSFAAPFVTAALAAAAGERDPRAAVALLASKAEDPGPPGRDPIFGYGLVQSVGCRS